MGSIVLVLLALLGDSRDLPEWLNYNLRETTYPKDKFYQGFVSRSFAEEENRLEIENEVISQSRIRLSESIRVSITSQSTSTLSNLNSESEERFEQQSVTKTKLEASGLETLTFFDDRKKIVYAFSFLKKRKFQSLYLRQFKEQMLSIESRINSNQSKTPSYGLLSELNTDLEIAKGLQNMLSYTGISAAVLWTREWNQYKDWVNERLDQIKEVQSIGLEEAAIYIRDGLISDIDLENVGSVKINRMTYKNTGLASELSVLFEDYFIDAMADKFTVVNEEQDWVINSTYWPLRDKIKITTTIHLEDGGELVRLISSSSIKADRAIIDDLSIDYEPLKTVEDVEKHQILTQHKPEGEIMLEVSTQKGSSSLVFMEGETLKFLIKASRPSYIQLINVWADGSKLLLLDNYFVGVSQVNRFIELPFEWETACPCGAEYIYAMASDSPHNIPKTRNESGFMFIEDPLSDILDKQRGFKKSVDTVEVSGSALSLVTLPVK